MPEPSDGTQTRMNLGSLTTGLRESLGNLFDALADNFRPKDPPEEEELKPEDAIIFDLELRHSLIQQQKACSDKPKDDVRRANEMLCQECSKAQDEYKRLKGVVEQLDREYEDSKEVDFIRRYGMLKGMIKRSVLHLKLSRDEHNKLIITCTKQKEELRRREEHITGLNTEEITLENENMTAQIKDYRSKTSIIQDLIETMERNYENSKRYIIVQRYRLLKTTIKTVIHNKWIQ